MAATEATALRVGAGAIRGRRAPGRGGRGAGGVPRAQDGAQRRPGSRRRAGADGRWRANAWVKAGILLGFRLGRVRPAAPGRPVSLLRQGHLPAPRPRPRGRRAGRAGRLGDPRRLLRRARRGLHAADVRQRRRLRGRGHHDRQPRAGRLLRPDRQAGAPLRRGADRRGAGAGGRAAGHHRGRRAGRRKLRGLRGNGRAGAGGAGAGHGAHRRDGRVRPGARPNLPPRGRASAGDSQRRGGRARDAAGAERPGSGGGDLALRAGHREVSGREDRHGGAAGGAAAL